MLKSGILNLYSKELSLLQRFIDTFFCLFLFKTVVRNYSISPNEYLQFSLLVCCFSLISLSYCGLYRSWRGIKFIRLFERIIYAWILFSFSIASILFIFKMGSYFSRIEITSWLLCFFISITINNILVRKILRILRVRGYNTRNILFFGDYESLANFNGELLLNDWTGLKISSWFNPDEANINRGNFNNIILIQEYDQLESFVSERKVDLVIFSQTNPKIEFNKFLRIIGNSTIPLYYIPYLHLNDTSYRLTSIGNNLLIKYYGSNQNFVGLLFKRILDLVFSLILIIILSPIFLIIAVLIKTTSKGPVIFKQFRYGINGKEFTILKFRTMLVNEKVKDFEVKQASFNDPRVTTLGSFLRKFSLDELPQLFNVFFGEMSLVGPRPHASQHNEYYRDKIPGYMQRHSLKPGMTGLAQIYGLRGETRDIKLMEDRVKADLKYINEWSIFLDLMILLKTFTKIKSKNAF